MVCRSKFVHCLHCEGFVLPGNSGKLGRPKKGRKNGDRSSHSNMMLSSEPF